MAPVVLSGLLLAVIGIEWLRYSGGVPGDAGLLYTVFAWVAGSVVVLCLLAMVYPVWKMRCVYHRSFLGQDGAGSSPFVAARGTMFYLCLPAFPFVGDAPAVGGHDVF